MLANKAGVNGLLIGAYSLLDSVGGPAADQGPWESAYVNLVRARAADPAGWVHTYVDPNDPLKGLTSTPAANYKIGLMLCL